MVWAKSTTDNKLNGLRDATDIMAVVDVDVIIVAYKPVSKLSVKSDF